MQFRIKRFNAAWPERVAHSSPIMNRRIKLIAILVLALSAAWAIRPKTPSASAAVNVQQFLEAHCLACHDSKTKKGNLDLTALKPDFTDAQTFAKWVKVHDRVRDGEMPPKAAPQPDATTRAAFLKNLSQPLLAADAARIRREGRAVWRRMNRYEYENTLRDLLGAPWLQVKELLPEDGERHRFNKSGEALGVSHVQMSRYLMAAEYALREVMARDLARPATATTRYYAREQRAFTAHIEFRPGNTATERGTFPLIGHDADLSIVTRASPKTVGAADPVKRELEGIGVVASTYEPLEIRFNQFKAPAAGRYKLRVNAQSFWAGSESEAKWWKPSRLNTSVGRTREPVTLYAEIPPRQMRYLGSFDVNPEASVNEMDVYLLKDETIRPDAARLFRTRPDNWRNPLAQKDGQPGVAFRWLEVEGPIFDKSAGGEWPGQGHRLLFGDLPMQKNVKGQVEIVAQNPHADAERLLRLFLGRVYRRPMTEEDAQRFLKLADTALQRGVPFTEAMLTTYSAVLCSPAFITLEEKPGRLDDHALAARLAYFLWNSEPDAALRELAKQGSLRKPAVLRAQVERMLGDAKAQRFVSAFLDYWLDLRKVSNTSPDELLYPDYYLDDLLVESAEAETRAFFAELLRGNLPARNLVASNFVTINERLATLYGLPGVEGVRIRRVPLPPDSVRG